jgi:nicotinate-nucleotide adenylyltransferase
MNVSLYFGSFNPIHVGHLIIANHMAQENNIDQVWLIVSPQNPLKAKNTLLADYHRLNMVKIAIEDNPKLKASDVEFKLPIPSYTVHTLAHLKEKYPKNKFSLIMGEDNLRTFNKWFNYEYILKNHKIFVFPRIKTAQEIENLSPENEEISKIRNHSNVIFCENTPIMNISSSFIRESIKNKKDFRYLCNEAVYKYIDEMNFYK